MNATLATNLLPSIFGVWIDSGWPFTRILVGGTDVFVAPPPGVSAAVIFDLSHANAQITLPPGNENPQMVIAYFVGAEAGYTGSWSVPVGGAANIIATGFNGGAPSSSIPAGQVGGSAAFVWIALANGGAGQWLKAQ